MRALLWLLVVAAAATALAIFGRSNDGYALFVYPPYRVELSLVLFAVLALGLFALCYLIVRLVRHTLELPVHVRAFRLRRRRDAAQAAFASSLQGYLEGRYARAEKDAGVAYDSGATPGLAALIAARAAHELRRRERRDEWLAKAEAAGEAVQVARLVTEAELALAERDFSAARNALRSLHGGGPKHIATLRMLLRAERGAQNWDEVLRLATILAKRDAIAPAAAEEHKVQAHIELLSRAAGDRASLEVQWRRIAPRDQAHPRVALAAARQAIAAGAPALTREIVEKALAFEWSAALVLLYGELPEGAQETELRSRIEQAEGWLPAHAEDPQLLFALGSLCARAELWGKAQGYLEASLSFEESRGAHLELARLLERLGRPAEAARHYKRAAEIG